MPETRKDCLTIALFCENPERVLHFVLEEGDKVRIGRSPMCDISFESTRMARKISWVHCEITVVRDSKQELCLRIKDLSSNGTAVSLNGGSVQRLPRAELRDLSDGARIALPARAPAVAQESLLLRICHSTDSMQDSVDVSSALSPHRASAASPPLWVDAEESLVSSSSNERVTGDPCGRQPVSGTPLWQSFACTTGKDQSLLPDKIACAFETPARARLKGGLASQGYLKAWLGGA
mmetsp:Transcript_38888/g.70814  ORF Transcript_38888/g.70814 Transcript_38888/m.70814 type:complete len:236 (+) Transcript_38888:55-762(+)